MHRMVLLAVAAGVLGATAGWSASQDEARAVIEKAVQAYGGADNLARLRAVRMKAKGTYVVGENTVPMLMESVLQLPDQFKNTLQLVLPDKKLTVTQVFNRDRGWILSTGAAQALPAAQLAEMREAAHLTYVESILPLLRDSALKLTYLGETRIDGRAALGVRVSAAGRRDLTLYFHKASSLVIKTARRVPLEKKKDVVRETFYTSFMDVEGLKRPARGYVQQEGRRAMDVEVTEVKLVDRIDPNEFAMP